MKAINPATDELIKDYPTHTDEQAAEILDAVDKEFHSWRETSFEHRAKLMRAAAEVQRKNRCKYAEIITAEMGKTITESEAEVDKCAFVCDYYADNAEKFLADEIIESDAGKSFVAFEPIGTVLAVMPWNFPFWQVFRFAAPALAAGNAGLLKHASNVPGCALAIEQVLQSAGTPDGVFQTLLIGSDRVEPLIRDPRVRAVTLTGSDFAGRSVARAAGDSLKKTVLELGGSDPFVVLEDANLADAVSTAIIARTMNNGQSCIAAKRFLVADAVARPVAVAAQSPLGDHLAQRRRVQHSRQHRGS